ncbi:MAG: adenosylmethionine--8-amino-7-oxononanoate aminotransferase BioA [Bacteroidia bacterium]|nr:MAG: adenosylmethionine--8-amino-7-oxononanoate aminotransferase BioA [Bacteroidia bacterium]
MNYNQLDKQLIWHPFTHLKYQKENILITKAKGVYLYTNDGRKIIDGIGSWWVNVHGHSHPYIVKRLKEQLSQMEHCIFSGFTHIPAIELAQKLSKIVPVKQPKVFYSDNGSTSVEVAIKMALQYFFNLNQKNKAKVIAFRNAYHGDTFGGMSVAERNVFNLPFKKNLFQTYFIDIPTEKNFHKVKQQLLKHLAKQNVAAFIYEPIIQGAAGMIMYDAKFLDELIAICQQHQVICIADEVFTGFGKTGKLFASDYLKHKPDIMCLSKGLTGGFLPLGVTVANKRIYDAFVQDDKTKTFFHGHSFTANPLMCTSALANIELIEKSDFLEKIRQLEKSHREFAMSIKNHPVVKDVRYKGLVLALEIQTKDKTHYLNELSKEIETFFIQKNILLRPLGNVLYLVPPVCITQKQLSYIYTTIKEFLVKLSTKSFS